MRGEVKENRQGTEWQLRPAGGYYLRGAPS